MKVNAQAPLILAAFSVAAAQAASPSANSNGLAGSNLSGDQASTASAKSLRARAFGRRSETVNAASSSLPKDSPASIAAQPVYNSSVSGLTTLSGDEADDEAEPVSVPDSTDLGKTPATFSVKFGTAEAPVNDKDNSTQSSQEATKTGDGKNPPSQAQESDADSSEGEHSKKNNAPSQQGGSLRRRLMRRLVSLRVGGGYSNDYDRNSNYGQGSHKKGSKRKDLKAAHPVYNDYASALHLSVERSLPVKDVLGNACGDDECFADDEEDNLLQSRQDVSPDLSGEETDTKTDATTQEYVEAWKAELERLQKEVDAIEHGKHLPSSKETMEKRQLNSATGAAQGSLSTDQQAALASLVRNVDGNQLSLSQINPSLSSPPSIPGMGQLNPSQLGQLTQLLQPYLASQALPLNAIPGSNMAQGVLGGVQSSLSNPPLMGSLGSMSQQQIQSAMGSLPSGLQSAMGSLPSGLSLGDLQKAIPNANGLSQADLSSLLGMVQRGAAASAPQSMSGMLQGVNQVQSTANSVLGQAPVSMPSLTQLTGLLQGLVVPKSLQFDQATGQKTDVSSPVQKGQAMVAAAIPPNLQSMLGQLGLPMDALPSDVTSQLQAALAGLPVNLPVDDPSKLLSGLTGSLGQGASPLGSLGALASGSLGSLPLNSLPLNSLPLNSLGLGQLASLLGGVGGGQKGTQKQLDSVVNQATQGAADQGPLAGLTGGLPSLLGSLPLDSLPLNALPLNSLPLNSLGLGQLSSLLGGLGGGQKGIQQQVDNTLNQASQGATDQGPLAGLTGGLTGDLPSLLSSLPLLNSLPLGQLTGLLGGNQKGTQQQLSNSVNQASGGLLGSLTDSLPSVGTGLVGSLIGQRLPLNLKDQGDSNATATNGTNSTTTASGKASDDFPANGTKDPSESATPTPFYMSSPTSTPSDAAAAAFIELTHKLQQQKQQQLANNASQSNAPSPSLSVSSSATWSSMENMSGSSTPAATTPAATAAFTASASSWSWSSDSQELSMWQSSSATPLASASASPSSTGEAKAFDVSASASSSASPSATTNSSPSGPTETPQAANPQSQDNGAKMATQVVSPNMAAVKKEDENPENSNGGVTMAFTLPAGVKPYPSSMISFAGGNGAYPTAIPSAATSGGSATEDDSHQEKNVEKRWNPLHYYSRTGMKLQKKRTDTPLSNELLARAAGFVAGIAGNPQ